MSHLPGPHNKIFSTYKLLCDFIREVVEKHKAELNPAEPRDYIDSFLVEMMEVTIYLTLHLFSECNLISTFILLMMRLSSTFSIPEQKAHEPTDGFNEQNLIMCVLDLFLAGTETTSTTLCWGLIYLITNQDMQGEYTVHTQTTICTFICSM